MIGPALLDMAASQFFNYYFYPYLTRLMQEKKTKYALVPTSRVFFEELLKSDFFLEENGTTFLVTPTCARCNRLFGVGEVKEVEKRGNIVRIKINDLTATLNIYTNKVIQLGTFMNVDAEEKRAFMAFIGNLHVREGAGKRKSVIMLAEEVEAVGESVRNSWIINTAWRTMERIEPLRLNVSLKMENKELSESAFAFKEALEHYAIDDDKLDALGSMAINAVKGMWQDYSKTTGEMILETLNNAEKRSMGRGKLMKELKKKGLKEEWVEEIIDEFIVEGRCYEPEVGVLKVVEE